MLDFLPNSSHCIQGCKPSYWIILAANTDWFTSRFLEIPPFIAFPVNKLLQPHTLILYHVSFPQSSPTEYFDKITQWKEDQLKYVNNLSVWALFPINLKILGFKSNAFGPCSFSYWKYSVIGKAGGLMRNNWRQLITAPMQPHFFPLNILTTVKILKVKWENTNKHLKLKLQNE